MNRIKTLFVCYKFLVSRRKDNNQLSTVTHFLKCSLLQESLSLVRVLTSFLYWKTWHILSVSFFLVRVLTTFLYLKTGHISKHLFFLVRVLTTFLYWKTGHILSIFFLPFSKSDEKICQSFYSSRVLKLLLIRPNSLCFSNVPSWPCPPPCKIQVSGEEQKCLKFPIREKKVPTKAIVPNLIFRSFFKFFIEKNKNLILVLCWCESVSYVGSAPIILICLSSSKIIYTIFPTTFLPNAHL